LNKLEISKGQEVDLALDEKELEQKFAEMFGFVQNKILIL